MWFGGVVIIPVDPYQTVCSYLSMGRVPRVFVPYCYRVPWVREICFAVVCFMLSFPLTRNAADSEGDHQLLLASCGQRTPRKSTRLCVCVCVSVRVRVRVHVRVRVRVCACPTLTLACAVFGGGYAH